MPLLPGCPEKIGMLGHILLGSLVEMGVCFPRDNEFLETGSLPEMAIMNKHVNVGGMLNVQ